PIQRFSEVNITVQNSMANVERIFEVFDYEVDIKNEKEPKRLPKTEGDIKFENVNFTYIAERPDTPKHLVGKDPDIVERFKPDKKFYLIPPRTKPGPP